MNWPVFFMLLQSYIVLLRSKTLIKHMTFADFGLDEQILEAISYMGFENPTPIQEMSIPEIIDGNDLIASAQTGTGKTAAFVLPVLHKLISRQSKSKGINTLVIVPTRELAMQIDQQIQGIAYFSSIESIAIYGGGDGTDWETEKKALSRGTDIIIATPGKLLSHLNMRYTNFDHLEHLILDEADRMLDIGFFDDIMQIIAKLPKTRQSLLFSATMPPKVEKLAQQILNNPIKVQTQISKPAEGINQGIYLVYEEQKVPLVNKIVQEHPDFESILIFTEKKKSVRDILRALRKKNKSVEGISSDLEQNEREEMLLRFKARKTRILIATNLLSRGIDIKGINMVINFDVPNDAEDYVHRIGRTGRADAKGEAVTLVKPDDMNRFARIEKLIEKEVPRLKLADELGEGPQWKVGYRGKRQGGRKSYGKKSGGKNHSKRNPNQANNRPNNEWRPANSRNKRNNRKGRAPKNPS